MNTKIWCIGKLLMETSDDKNEAQWELEGLFEKEEDAIKNAKKEEFIVLINLNCRVPSSAKDCEKIYWPHIDKSWENSKHYKLTHS